MLKKVKMASLDELIEDMTRRSLATGYGIMKLHAQHCVKYYSEDFIMEYYKVLSKKYEFIKDVNKKRYFIAYGFTWDLLLDKYPKVKDVLNLLIYVSNDQDDYEQNMCDEVNELGYMHFVHSHLGYSKVMFYPYVAEFVEMQHGDKQEEILRGLLPKYKNDPHFLHIWYYVGKHPRLLNVYFHYVMLHVQDFLYKKQYLDAYCLLIKFNEENLTPDNLKMVKYYKMKITKN